VKAKITVELLRKLPNQDVDIYDTKYPGLVLRCRASGHHVYRLLYGRGKWETLGRADTLNIDAARGLARDKLTAIAHGADPQAERKAHAVEEAASVMLAEFIDQRYEPWAIEHHKRGKRTIVLIRTVWRPLLTMKLGDITPWVVEKWRTERLREQSQPKPRTLNGYVTLLKGMLSKAVEWHVLTIHPLAGKAVKPLKVDHQGRTRFLSHAEETRLRTVLADRDQRQIDRRNSANAWRRARGYPDYPKQTVDHLSTVVLLALNTGARKGELFALQWRDIDWVGKQLVVRGEGAKTSQTRYIPLNREAIDVLQAWQKIKPGAHDAAYIFPGRADSASGKLDDVKKGWYPVLRKATIEGFTFHDLRHSFASKLVQAGVDLNTVRELLGHTDIKMTLRYAHLAPKHKAAAVARLVPRQRKAS
jgi:integrase